MFLENTMNNAQRRPRCLIEFDFYETTLITFIELKLSTVLLALPLRHLCFWNMVFLNLSHVFMYLEVWMIHDYQTFWNWSGK